ncbi:hypothetical protein [Pseudomonas syringae]|uniref:hypothetical protein n=1 Tax=Pseudomonas syringae TaxID=317 RepID=UPI003F76D8F3
MGVRNVKLRFSRKLLYFGGVISVAETAFVAQSDKNQLIADILDKTVLERVQDLGEKIVIRLRFLIYTKIFWPQLNAPKIEKYWKV